MWATLREVAVSVTEWPATAHAAYRLDLATRKWGGEDVELAAVWCLMVHIVQVGRGTWLSADDSIVADPSPLTCMARPLDALPCECLPLRTMRCVHCLRAWVINPKSIVESDALVLAIANMTHDMEERGALRLGDCVLEAVLQRFPFMARTIWCRLRSRQAAIAATAGAVARARALYQLVVHEATTSTLPAVATEAAGMLASLDSDRVKA